MGFFCLVFAMPSYVVCLYVPCGHLLSSGLSFAVSHCVCVTFPLVFWARCGT